MRKGLIAVALVALVATAVFIIRGGTAPGSAPGAAGPQIGQGSGAGQGFAGGSSGGAAAAPAPAVALERAGRGGSGLGAGLEAGAEPSLAGAGAEVGADAGMEDEQPPAIEGLIRRRLELADVRTEAVSSLIAVTLARPQAPYVADLNGDDRLDALDLVEFQRRLEAGDMAADFSGDGALDHMDSVAFQSELAAKTRAPAVESLALQTQVARTLHVHAQLQLSDALSREVELQLVPLIEAVQRQR